MTTPDISHLTSKDYQFVYEPAEDSFLLIDALEKDIEFISNHRPTVCLEIGSGSGIFSTFLARELGPHIFTICTDINPRAAEVSKRTACVNKVCCDQVITDLVSGLSDRLKHQVDVLLFNPPYVVTPSEEVGSHGIEASWAGGTNGREVIDRVGSHGIEAWWAGGTNGREVIDKVGSHGIEASWAGGINGREVIDREQVVPALLSESGMFYMVAIKENDPEDIGKTLRNSGLKMTTVMTRKTGPEFLSILRFTR